MLFYTGTTLAAAMYIVGAVEIVLVSEKKNCIEKNNIIIYENYSLIDIYGTVGIHIWRFYKRC